MEFWQGDAHNLKPQFTNYDLVLACNLVDRLYHPARFLEDITRRINPGGLLVLFSPYTWLEEFTPKENWLGGPQDRWRERHHPGRSAGRPGAGRFPPRGPTRDVPFVIRETARKFQHTLSQMSIWEKNDA